MLLIRTLKKIFLIPLWIIVAIVTMLVSLAVNVLGIAKVISGILLSLLLIGTIICYQDILQIIFLTALIVMGYLLLFAGIAIEVILETTKRKIGKAIWA